MSSAKELGLRATLTVGESFIAQTTAYSVGKEAASATTIAATTLRLGTIAEGTAEKFAANIRDFFGKNGRFRQRPGRSSRAGRPDGRNWHGL